ncbi:hypothetical protein [Salinisphaera sp. PC39]|uniref:hypothetical protein n=1 Tax=Salinisphaera sp. PC39 TaxID=1304156 RepID=UPI003341ACD5
MIRLWILLILLVLVALGLAHLVRGAIRRSREELKDVDRSKLRDLDKDDWDKEN